MKKNILIVEDEIKILNLIKNRLSTDIYNIDIATNGKEAIDKITSKNYDLITLDVMLPFVDGFEICKRLRENSKDTLVIMISALDTIEFKQKGYDIGIDDYIAKPFSPKELALKISASLKRKEEISSLKKESLINIILNEDSKDIIINGFTIEFTPSEYLILSTLILNKNRVYSRAELAQLIYDNYFGDIDEQGINSHIYNIREKIKPFYSKNIIKTIRGIGYKIDDN